MPTSLTNNKCQIYELNQYSFYFSSKKYIFIFIFHTLIMGERFDHWIYLLEKLSYMTLDFLINIQTLNFTPEFRFLLIISKIEHVRFFTFQMKNKMKTKFKFKTTCLDTIYIYIYDKSYYS